WTTYTDPEVVHVGLYDYEAEAEGIQVETFVQSISDLDRGRTDGDTNGFVKIHVKEGSDKILGATIVAKHAGEMISEITVAMAGDIGLRKLANVIHPYPTQSEAIKKVADMYNRTRLTPTVMRLFEKWMAWSRR
ncbi:MAG: FAD-containing oxidoreductase, partial [Chloroflexota bacterium]